MKATRVGLLALCLVVILSSGLWGCGGSTTTSSAKATINLYTDGDVNLQGAWTTLIAAFNKQNPNITVKLQATGNNGASITKLIGAVKAGQKETDIDIMEADDGGISRIFSEAGENALVQLTTKEIPNLKDVTAVAASDKGRALPYRGTTVVLAYNSATVPNPPKTADELYQWIKDHPGRFAYNDPSTGGSGGGFVISAVYNSMPADALTSADAANKAKWTAGFDLLKSLNPYMYKAAGKVQYPQKNTGTLQLLENGQIDMMPAWADMFLTDMAKGLMPKTCKITQIDPQLPGGIVRLVVPSSSKNKEAAYTFMNYVASAEGQGILVDSLKAIPVIDQSKLSKTTIDQLAGLKMSKFRSYSIGDLEAQLFEKWQNEIANMN